MKHTMHGSETVEHAGELPITHFTAVVGGLLIETLPDVEGRSNEQTNR